MMYIHQAAVRSIRLDVCRAIKMGLFLTFFFLAVACRILAPQPGIEPMEAWSLNHWTTREVPKMDLKMMDLNLKLLLYPHSYKLK